MTVFIREPVRTWLERLENAIPETSDFLPTEVQKAALDAGSTPTSANRYMTLADRPVVDVRRFGALGNGSHDDTAAFQAATAACPVGGVVEVAPTAAHYVLSDTVEITTNISLRGTHGLVALTMTDPTKACIKVNPASAPTDSTSVESFKISGGLYAIHVTGQGIYRDGGLRHIEASGQASACIRVDGGWIGTRSSDLNLYSAPIGLDLYSASGGTLNAAAFDNVRVNAATTRGVSIDSGVAGGISSVCHFANLLLEGNERVGLYLRNSAADMYTPYFENNGSSGDGGANIYPDIYLVTSDGMGGSGGPSRAVLWNGNVAAEYSGKQGGVRVFMSNANCIFASHHTFWTGGLANKIDANSTNGAITLAGVTVPAVLHFPTGSSFTSHPNTGAMLLSAQGLGVYTSAEFSPEGAIVAEPGSLCLRTFGQPTTGGQLYVKVTGAGLATGWVRLESFAQTVLDLTAANGGDTNNPTINFPTPSGTPGTPLTPAGWLPVQVNGVTKFLPYYA